MTETDKNMLSEPQEMTALAAIHTVRAACFKTLAELKERYKSRLATKLVDQYLDLLAPLDVNATFDMHYTGFLYILSELNDYLMKMLISAQRNDWKEAIDIWEKSILPKIFEKLTPITQNIFDMVVRDISEECKMLDQTINSEQYKYDKLAIMQFLGMLYNFADIGVQIKDNLNKK